jgi:hypothetical protein
LRHAVPLFLAARRRASGGVQRLCHHHNMAQTPALLAARLYSSGNRVAFYLYRIRYNTLDSKNMRALLTLSRCASPPACTSNFRWRAGWSLLARLRLLAQTAHRVSRSISARISTRNAGQRSVQPPAGTLQRRLDVSLMIQRHSRTRRLQKVTATRGDAFRSGSATLAHFSACAYAAHRAALAVLGSLLCRFGDLRMRHQHRRHSLRCRVMSIRCLTAFSSSVTSATRLLASSTFAAGIWR